MPFRGQSGRPYTQARVFTVMQQKADATTKVVIGTIKVFSHEAYTLIDPCILLKLLVETRAPGL